MLINDRLSLTSKPTTPVTLTKSDVLKVTFQVVEKDGGNGVQPHQTFLRFYDKTTGEEGVQPVRVTSGGKAKFELVGIPESLRNVGLHKFLQNMAKPPLSLPPTSPDTTLQVTLLLGSPSHPPLSVELFDLVIPASLPGPTHLDDAMFHPQPEIHHTFRPDAKLPPTFVSAIFTVLVLAPWISLLGLVSYRSRLLLQGADALVFSGDELLHGSYTFSRPVSSHSY